MVADRIRTGYVRILGSRVAILDPDFCAWICGFRIYSLRFPIRSRFGQSFSQTLGI
jgi:hypothetical protein